MAAIRSRVACVLGIAGDGHAPARGAHGRALRHGVLRVVRALGVHVGPEARDQRVGACPRRRRPRGRRRAARRAAPPAPSAGISGRPGPFSRATEASELMPDEEHVAERARGARDSGRGRRAGGRSSRWRGRCAGRGAASSAARRAASSTPTRGAIAAHRARTSSAGVTVAVPRFMTTRPPATLASRAASTGEAPAASATVKALMTVSPAPVTSAISSVPWIGMNVTGAVALEAAPCRGCRA